MTREELITRIKEIGDMEDNWDMEGGKKISNRVIEKAIKIAKEITPIPTVFPLRKNGIQLEWEKEGLYLEMEILEDSINILNMYKNEEREVIIEKEKD